MVIVEVMKSTQCSMSVSLIPGTKSRALIGQRDSVFVVNRNQTVNRCVWFGAMAAKIPCFFVFLD